MSITTNQLPKWAYFYALMNGPCDVSRQIACEEPQYAYLYARFVDKHPREDTRTAACKDSLYTHVSVDQKANV